MTAWVFLDVDGTLREGVDYQSGWDNGGHRTEPPRPRPHLREFIALLQQLPVRIVVWSAGGEHWARQAVSDLGIRHAVAAIHAKGESWRQYVGPKFFVDDWPTVLDNVVGRAERRHIVREWYREFDDDRELLDVAQAIGAWVRNLDQGGADESQEQAAGGPDGTGADHERGGAR